MAKYAKDKKEKSEKKKAELQAKLKGKNAFRAAVILHGCGDKDGTDVIAASSLLILLSQ